jgi:hypothetical protein
MHRPAGLAAQATRGHEQHWRHSHPESTKVHAPDSSALVVSIRAHVRAGAARGSIFRTRQPGTAKQHATAARRTKRGWIRLLAAQQYQVWYRNAIGPCGAGANLMNAVPVTWVP